MMFLSSSKTLASLKSIIKNTDAQTKPPEMLMSLFCGDADALMFLYSTAKMWEALGESGIWLCVRRTWCVSMWKCVCVWAILLGCCPESELALRKEKRCMQSSAKTCSLIPSWGSSCPHNCSFWAAVSYSHLKVKLKWEVTKHATTTKKISQEITQ